MTKRSLCSLSGVTLIGLLLSVGPAPGPIVSSNIGMTLDA